MNALRLAALLCAGGLAGAAWATENISPDDMERVEAELTSTGAKVSMLKHKNRTWRPTAVEVLKERVVDESSKDICFEAKFDSADIRAMKLFKNDARLVVLDEGLMAFFKKLRPMDNIWLCGTLRPRTDDKPGIELKVEDVIRLPEDFDREQNRFAKLSGLNDADGLIELGHRITRLLQDGVGLDFKKRDNFQMLQRKAWSQGLTLKEAKLEKSTDADAMFALAEQWRELLRNNRKFHEWVVRTLSIDPEHMKAVSAAREQLGMEFLLDVKKWVTKDEARKHREDLERMAALADEQKRKELARQRLQLEEAIAERPIRLAALKSAVRVALDLKSLTEALEALGKAVQSSPDLRFGRAGVDLLANVADPTAVSGLKFAAECPLPEIRTDVYRALSWRGGDNALRTLTHALRKEKDVSAVSVGVDALVDRADRPALEALIQCLDTSQAKSVDVVVVGLKRLQNSNLATKDEWLRWWDSNKGRTDLFPQTP